MLTDLAISKVKPTESLKKLSDGGGLQIWILPTGGKTWRFAYRYLGKQKSLVLGKYPYLSIREARTKCEEARDLLEKGIDPSTAKKQAKVETLDSAANTFSILAAELLEKKVKEGKASATIGKREWLYSLANKDIGNLPIREITARQVLLTVKKAESKGHIETAHKLRSAIGEVFRFAIAQGKADTDVTRDLIGALQIHKSTPRAAILDPKKLADLLRAIEGFEGQFAIKSALKLLILTYVRPVELRMAEWSHFDLEQKVWSIPAHIMKTRQPHRVPLSPQAIEILKELKPITGNIGTLVFQNIRTWTRPISENTLNVALRRLGFGKEEVCSHGFRRTASTFLNEATLPDGSRRWSADAIEASLAHQDRNEIRGIYNAAQYWPERVRMANWWADYVDEIRAE